jgi:CDP-diacylglycerol--glycerol-3-phosphate 3-phosphatidyltransferase
MSVYDLKPRFQALLRPVSNTLARAGVTANAVTIGAMVGSFIMGWQQARATERAIAEWSVW